MDTQKHPSFPPGVEWLVEALVRFTNGGVIDISPTGELRINGTKVTVTGAALNALVAGVAGGYKVARGQHTTVAASDTVATGLATVVMAVAVLDSDPTLNPLFVTASIGDQAGAPAAGSILIKGWKPTAANDATPIAATTFAKKVNWIAIGT